MKGHLINASWGVLDYVCYPAAMFIVAPVILHRLGAAEYGIWSVAAAVISIGGVVASGFADANMQRVAQLRGHTDITAAKAAMARTVRSLLTIHLVLGALLALLLELAAPVMASRLAHAQLQETQECLIALRIAAALVLLRSLETVPISTQRAFEQFGSAVRISTGVKVSTLGAAAALVSLGGHVISLLLATAAALLIGTALQYRELYRLLGFSALLPLLDRGDFQTLLRTGLFTWLQAVGGVVFSQLDRVVLGIAVGAAAAAPYLLCVQFAHPVAGLAGSALSFLFPHLSMRFAQANRDEIWKTLRRAFLCNLMLVVVMSALLMFFGERMIRLWAGASVAHETVRLMPPIVAGAALLGLSVTATYALLAIGRFRMVALTGLTIRAVLLLAILLLASGRGLMGLAWVRLSYGVLSMLLYIPLWRRLRTAPHAFSYASKLENAIPHGGSL